MLATIKESKWKIICLLAIIVVAIVYLFPKEESSEVNNNENTKEVEENEFT